MGSDSSLEFNLLRKTELWIKGISLQNALLDDIAGVIAAVLELEKKEVMVVDVREDHIVLDILRPVLRANQMMGKGEEIFNRLRLLPGITLQEGAAIHSEGALGWVSLDSSEAQEAIEKSQKMGAEIRSRVARRAIVFSTGFEVKDGLIADTNFPLIESRLKIEGYTVKFGGVLPDDMGTIAHRLNRAIDEGYGLVLTTGGVGAEAKDCTVEGMLQVDPSAATPYILKFEPGTGRHVKEGVRIAVGRVGLSRLVSFPGPTREVAIGLERLLEGLKKDLEDKELAEYVAAGIRAGWRSHGHHPPRDH
jgi:hypothetical protein